VSGWRGLIWRRDLICFCGVLFGLRGLIWLMCLIWMVGFYLDGEYTLKITNEKTAK
jgi:hypothetical protein